MKYSKTIFTRFRGNSNYKTPEDVYKELDSEFHFDFDLCPLNEEPVEDGLKIIWGKRAFVNPPYNNPKRWIEKGLCEIVLYYEPFEPEKPAPEKGKIEKSAY